MKIRLLKKKEIIQASKIVGKAYSKEWGKNSVSELNLIFNKEALNPVYLAVEEKGQIIAFIGYCTAWMDYSVREITWVNVLPEFQGKGIGTILIKEAIKRIKKEKTKYKPKIILLSCKKHLVHFYEEFGFRKAYPIGKDFLMGLKIK
jgi:GNAT superfamily N-acetyltransferase